MATAPPVITALPAPPDPNDRSTFNTRAYPWSVAQQTLATEVGAVAANVYANAQVAEEQAELATTNGAAQVALAAQQAELATTKAAEAATSATNAEASAAAALASRNAAATSAADSEASRIAASKLNLGNKAAPPTVDNQGAALLAGATYYDTTLNKWRVWTGAAWGDGISAMAGVSSINGLVGDLTGFVTETGAQSLINKELVDPKLTLGGTNGTAGQIPVSQGEGLPPVWSTVGVPVTADEVAAMKANIMLNAFRTAIVGSLTVQQMVDGVADEYEDQTGVSTANSSGFGYDSTNDWYESGTSYSDSLSTGNRTGSITVTTNLAITQGSLASLVDGSTASGNGVYFTYDSNISDNWVQFDLGSGVEKSMGEARVYAYESTTRGFWKWQGSNNGTTWTDISASVQILIGTTTWTITNQTAFRHFRIQGVSGGIDAAGGITNGWREVEFSLGVAGAATLLSNEFTALAAPTSGLLVLWQENRATTVLNTDLTAWLSRDAGKTFTTNFATSNSTLLCTAHGLSNGDRVMVTSSSQDLPSGLSRAVVYFVVQATTNDFKLSLTSGGAAVTFSSNWTGTHNVREWTQVTLASESEFSSMGRVLMGSADFSGQPTGTAVRYALVMPSGTATRFHGAAIQWR